MPWHQVMGGRIDGQNVVVGGAGRGPDLATLAGLVTDVELFLTVVAQRAGRG